MKNNIADARTSCSTGRVSTFGLLDRSLFCWCKELLLYRKKYSWPALAKIILLMQGHLTVLEGWICLVSLIDFYLMMQGTLIVQECKIQLACLSKNNTADARTSYSTGRASTFSLHDSSLFWWCKELLFYRSVKIQLTCLMKNIIADARTSYSTGRVSTLGLLDRFRFCPNFFWCEKLWGSNQNWKGRRGRTLNT
jgi:hypothetical protein